MPRSTAFFNFLKERSAWVRRETLKIHKIASETRIASSLSCVEILTVLYYGGILKYDPVNPRWEKRDRLIISKGHGAISIYPILSDLKYFPKEELARVCKEKSILGGIPDICIPGFETINGSLGHGLGVACGMALALKRRRLKQRIFVLAGDGELYEGSVWEAIMFAGAHKLDNLILIVDNNKVCMLDYCKNILDIEPLDKKFTIFGWDVKRINGHNEKSVYQSLSEFKKSKGNRPNVIIADTIKGKGVPRLEKDSLSHIKNLSSQEADVLIRGLE